MKLRLPVSLLSVGLMSFVGAMEEDVCSRLLSLAVKSPSKGSPSPASVAAARVSPGVAVRRSPFDPNRSVYSTTQEILNGPEGKALKWAIGQGFSTFLVTSMTLQILKKNPDPQVGLNVMKEITAWQKDKVRDVTDEHVTSLKKKINCGETKSADRIPLMRELRGLQAPHVPFVPTTQFNRRVAEMFTKLETVINCGERLPQEDSQFGRSSK